jgi:hypothetical protein
MNDPLHPLFLTVQCIHSKMFTVNHTSDSPAMLLYGLETIANMMGKFHKYVRTLSKQPSYLIHQPTLQTIIAQCQALFQNLKKLQSQPILNPDVYKQHFLCSDALNLSLEVLQCCIQGLQRQQHRRRKTSKPKKSSSTKKKRNQLYQAPELITPPRRRKESLKTFPKIPKVPENSEAAKAVAESAKAVACSTSPPKSHQSSARCSTTGESLNPACADTRSIHA